MYCMLKVSIAQILKLVHMNDLKLQEMILNIAGYFKSLVAYFSTSGPMLIVITLVEHI